MKWITNQLMLFCCLSCLSIYAEPMTPQKSTIESQLIEGQILVDNGFIYRKYLGKTEDGYFKAQNYYKGSNNKQSSILRIKDKNHLQLLQALDSENLDKLYFDDQLTLWSPQGHKTIELFIKENKAEGSWKQWYDNGMLNVKGSYNQGKKEGVWSYWDDRGNLEMKRYFYHGELQWQKQLFNLSGL